MLAKIGDLKPIGLTGISGKSYHFLASPNSVGEVLTDKPPGIWALPAPNEIIVQNSLSTGVGDLLNNIIHTSPIYNLLSDQKYMELTTRVTDLINRDWTFFPQLRYATSQIFAGVILVNKLAALLVNCTEPYGRSKTVDVHHEPRLGTTMHHSSFPKKATSYGWINTNTADEDNATKLKIGKYNCL